MADAEFSDVIDLGHRWVTDLRIPLLASPFARRWQYEVALIVPGPLPDGWAPDAWVPVWPTEEEARVVSSFIDYRRDWYNEGWKRRKLERALDVDDSANTVLLVKRADGWAYAKASWLAGWSVIPPLPTARGYDGPRFAPNLAGLRGLLDHINDVGGSPFSRWTQWKAARL